MSCFSTIFQENEVLFLQAGDRSIRSIDYLGIDADQRHVATEDAMSSSAATRGKLRATKAVNRQARRITATLPFRAEAQ